MGNTINSLNLILNKGRGNPYHDELGKFTTGPGGSSGKGGAKSKDKLCSDILEKMGFTSDDYARTTLLKPTLKEQNEETLKSILSQPLADLSKKRLKEVADKRGEMWREKNPFSGKIDADLWLRFDVIGGNEDCMKKAKESNLDPSIEIGLSKKIMGDKKIRLYRRQPGDFDENVSSESRWSEVPVSSSLFDGDTVYTTVATKDNILLHPEVIYSCAGYNDSNIETYSQEREYVLSNKGLKVEKLNKRKKG